MIGLWLFPGMHIEFRLPEGKSVYEGFEDDGYVEICLELASNYQAVLASRLNVTLIPIQQTSPSIFVKGLQWICACVCFVCEV